MFILDKERQTEVKASFDTVVCGGGIAGVSAALAAARGGAKTLLIEKQYLLGGLATLGLVTIYLPLCDGCGRQVSFGIADELLRLSVRHGSEAGRDAKPWFENGTVEERTKRRFEVQYNPNLFAIEAEKLLTDAGVTILYGAGVCGVMQKDGIISHVLTENIDGRCAYAARNVIDATGDAELSMFAGCEYKLGREKDELCQPMTLCFRLSGVDKEKYKENELHVIISNSKKHYIA